MLAFVAILFAVSSFPESKGRSVPWRDLTSQVGPVKLPRYERRLFREQSRLDEFLGLLQAKRLPRIDFSARQVLFLSPGPRSSSGYAVDVLGVTERDGNITVRVRERTPRLGEHVAPRVTYPYRLLSLPAGDDVYVDWIGR